MEIFQALQLMFLFGMLILALLAYLQKNRPPSSKPILIKPILFTLKSS
ncbi:putative holin-like toxin [Paenibacillus filicis]|uniref:Holin-like toxin n=1 Tax=Paenibacillus gyeongsangnamensis TaxID=3388067 RepID=A0ABT4QFT9_9BACL|nr:putative holin-like toxin [Paenibacillus filicis]MCZ8515662.1 putative holin-like toxin [Paenibacillus filicis]